MSWSMRYADRVRNMLLSADTRGITQRELHQRSRTPNYNLKDLVMLMDAWQKRGWVDKYTDPHHILRVYYRATQKLIDDWPIITRVVDELVIGPKNHEELDHG